MAVEAHITGAPVCAPGIFTFTPEPITEASTDKVDMAALRRMSMVELANLGAALRTLSDVLAGFLCQPRFRARDGEPNAASEVLEDFLLGIHRYMDAANDTVKAACPVKSCDIEARAWALIACQADRRENLSAVMLACLEGGRA